MSKFISRSTARKFLRTSYGAFSTTVLQLLPKSLEEGGPQTTQVPEDSIMVLLRSHMGRDHELQVSAHAQGSLWLILASPSDPEGSWLGRVATPA